MVVALPIGLMIAIYLSEYASPRARGILKPVLEILAGIPTVVFGFFALGLMTPLLQGIFSRDTVEIFNVASAGIVIGILIIPLVSSMSEDALSAVPVSYTHLETLRDGAIEDPPAAERFFGHMEVEVDEMTQMVQELLELSRIESGQAPLRLFPTTVAKLVEPAVERLHAQAGRANLSLNLVLGPNLPEVMVDADRVGTVILNLVHNAIKFTPAEGQVTVSARAVADAVVISVADTGTGIPAEDVPRIFERFYNCLLYTSICV